MGAHLISMVAALNVEFVCGGKRMAKLILLTSDDCPPCVEAESVFRKRWAEEIVSDEAIVSDIDKDEEAQEFWAVNELPTCPVIVVTTDTGKLITILDPLESTEEKKEASPTPLDKNPA